MTEASEAPNAGRTWDVPVLLALSATALGLGLFLPVITIKQLVFWTDTFSVVTGIRALYEEKQLFLAAVVFIFSIIFPIVKLISMFLIWGIRLSKKKREMLLRWLGYLGKWSMLDVFIVAMTIVIAKISKLADAEAKFGIYVFAFSIGLSIVASMRLDYLSRKNLI